jgi:hypothetical protein
MVRNLLSLSILLSSFALQAQEAKRAPEEIEVTFETKAYQGKYSPRHVLAVWVVDEKQNYVRTLSAYGNKYARKLTRWTKATGEARPKPDAITGATLKAHEPVRVTWDGTDAHGKEVPDGTYMIRMEYTETNKEGPAYQVVVKKGTPVGTSTNEKGSKYFTDVKVRYVAQEMAKAE